MSKAIIPLSDRANAHFLGTRFMARELRRQLEHALEEHRNVTIDFSTTSVTQSFIDELMGTLILKSGPDLITRLTFKECSTDVKEIIRLVVGKRIKDYNEAHQH